jgi:serine protease Do
MEQRSKITTILAAVAMVGLMGGAGYGVSKTAKAEAPAGSEPAARPAPILVPGNFTELARTVRDGVVNIQTVKNLKGGGLPFRHFFGGPFQGQDPFRGFLGPDQDEGGRSGMFQQRSLGSGFILDKEGYIVTNNHVVDGADEIKVKLADGKEFEAKIVGRDPKTDLALLQIKGSPGLQPLKLGDSDALQVGSWVVAVGSPFGLEQTVTAGIVSAKGRTIGAGPYDDFIQTDASINPGNSGGPLIDTEGEVVGINTAIVASGQGIGFAIPSNLARGVIEQLKDKGRVTRGWVGVTIQPMTPELAQALGLKQSTGALVAQVVPGGPADKAGIKRGDVIVAYDGKDVAEPRDLPQLVAATPVGKSVPVKLSREGKTITAEVRVGELEDKTAEVATNAPSRKRLGIEVQNLTPEIAGAMGLHGTSGVLVAGVEPGSPAAEAGIERGDVIRELNREPVKDVQTFVRQMERVKGGTALLLVQRGDSTLYAAVKIG